MFFLKKSPIFWTVFALFIVFQIGLSAMDSERKDGGPTSPRRLAKDSIPVTFDPAQRDWLSRSYPRGSGSPNLTILIAVHPEGMESQSGLKSWSAHYPISYGDSAPAGLEIDLTKLNEGRDISAFRGGQGAITLDCTITGDNGPYRGWSFEGFTLRKEDLARPFCLVISERVKLIFLGEKDTRILTEEGSIALKYYNDNGKFPLSSPRASSPLASPVSSPSDTVTWSAYAYSWVKPVVHPVIQWMWPPKEPPIR